MESKLLNFPDALRVAELLSPYPIVSRMGEGNILDFVGWFFDSIPTSVIAKLMVLLLKDEPPSVDPQELVTGLIKSLTENNIKSLLLYYQVK